MALVVSSLNVDSLVSFNRRVELSKFLTLNRIDIGLLQETKLDSTIKFKIDGYNIIRNDFIKGQHGTAIVVKNSYNIRDPYFYNDIVTANSISVQTDGIWRVFTSAYIPPGLSLSLPGLINFFTLHRGSFIGGDLNARNRIYGDVSENIYGIILAGAADKMGLNILSPPFPTCFRSIHGSFIDKFVNMFPDLDCGGISVIPSFSDHAAILTHFHTTSGSDISSIKRFDFDHINIEKFNSFVELNSKRLVIPLNSNISEINLNKIVLEYENIIQLAVRKFVPVARTNTSSRIILSATTRKLQTSCKRIQRKIIRNYQAPFHLRRDWINDIKNLRVMIKNSIQYETAAFFTNTFNGIESCHDAFGVIKRFTGHKKRIPMGGLLYADSGKDIPIMGTKNIANSLGDLFGANSRLPEAVTSNMEPIVNRELTYLNSINTEIVFSNNLRADLRYEREQLDTNNLLPLHQQNILTSAEEVHNVIKSRPNKKSTGSDNLPFTIIRQFSPTNILFLAILFNHLLAKACFPECWKHALVTAIPKAGKDNDILSNWRPISQLPCISKIFEKIISFRLNNVIHKLGIFENQFGFLKHNSTTHALAKIQDSINAGLGVGELTTVIALDLKAAFDVMWHDGLIYKMNKLGFGPCVCKIVQNFLKNRSFSVRLDGFTTNPIKMNYGSPQGSVLSPILFNIHIHDIPTDKFAKITQYADDTTVYITHKEPKWAQNIINQYLLKITSFLRDWKLFLSEGKTELINIVGAVKDTGINLRKRARNMKISLNGNILPFSKSIRLLGVQFQINNLATENIKIRLSKARRAKMAIKRILSNQHIDINVKKTIYKLFIRSILTYGSPIWCQPPQVSSHQMELLRRFERTCLRNVANIKRPIGCYKHVKIKDIYDISNIERIDNFITKLHINFYQKCLLQRSTKFSYTQFNGTGRKFKPIYYLHKLHTRGRLLDNGLLKIFHRRYNNRSGLVYNPAQ